MTFVFLLPPEVAIVAGGGNSCGALVKGRRGPEKAELPFGSLMSCWKACQPHLHFNLRASLYKTLYSGSALKYLLRYNHDDLYMSPPITLWGLQPRLAERSAGLAARNARLSVTFIQTAGCLKGSLFLMLVFFFFIFFKNILFPVGD